MTSEIDICPWLKSRLLRWNWIIFIENFKCIFDYWLFKKCYHDFVRVKLEITF